MENILFGNSNSSTKDLTNNVKVDLDSLPRLSGNRCIYRVPKRLRCVNDKAYTPQVVSIGPLHHGAEGLKSMEEHKMRFLRDYIKRTEVDLEYYVSIVKNQEEKLRSCYAEHIGFSSDEFVKIILVDAVFIIELILKHDPRACETNEPNYVMESPWMVDDIMPDLLLLENQLPLFILEDLYYPKTVTYDGMTLSFASLSKLLFTNLLDPEPSKTNFFNPDSNKENSLLNHLIDLLINSAVPKKPQFGELAEGKALSLPTATKLHQAGVKFEVSKGKKLLDIQFSNGVLQIPKLRIVDSATEAKIRNLIAFEQCHDRVNRCVSHYVVLMGSLVDKSEDVELLVKFEIIENRIGDNNRVVTLMNKLGDGVQWDHKKFMFAEIFSQLIEHYKNPWNNHKANLKQNYFNSPWKTLSVIAASLLLILTFIQTVCSIISVVEG
ncbi:UPF0481 protein At3g47200-like [Humulus lupulus]|uniref:UPF0481 protein At3g47200-like n=1 Tax=Humulus lupulus TaxID=3486 RepID=UPI002B40D489|nr:UPF0481 protein At3g47200-like [Humulus lupulus]XP_062083170.1 UPF0481 protein At3g47200-like [Humulus lupulus]